ncbi:MAG: hypothetical protein H6945_01610 [Zoogloeaceae bacterium]|nr:hypothetical protein [Rhodocyclaceae bacterium]MCP5234421.1 hypothetical protein [Zoogloeaceae bacterium]
MSSSPVLAAGLAAIIATLLGAFLWYEHEQFGTRHVQRPQIESMKPPSNADDTARTIRPDPPTARSSVRPGLTRCDGPHGTSYQDFPCSGAQVPGKIDGGTVSVIAPQDRARFAGVEPEKRKVATVARAGSSPRIKLPSSKPSRAQICNELRDRIRAVEGQERIGGSAGWMDHLRERKRSVQDAMWQSGC